MERGIKEKIVFIFWCYGYLSRYPQEHDFLKIIRQSSIIIDCYHSIFIPYDANVNYILTLNSLKALKNLILHNKNKTLQEKL